MKQFLFINAESESVGSLTEGLAICKLLLQSDTHDEAQTGAGVDQHFEVVDSIKKRSAPNCHFVIEARVVKLDMAVAATEVQVLV